MHFLSSFLFYNQSYKRRPSACSATAYSFMPRHSGIRHRSRTIPAKPTATPGTSMPQSMVMHIPVPSASVPASPIKPRIRLRPLKCRTAGLPDIIRCNTYAHSSTAIPAAPVHTPCTAAPHSGSRHMHIPSAKRPAPGTHRNIVIKSLFFISISSFRQNS